MPDAPFRYRPYPYSPLSASIEALESTIQRHRHHISRYRRDNERRVQECAALEAEYLTIQAVLAAMDAAPLSGNQHCHATPTRPIPTQY